MEAEFMLTRRKPKHSHGRNGRLPKWQTLTAAIARGALTGHLLTTHPVKQLQMTDCLKSPGKNEASHHSK
jgi:hypothetical protein